MIERLLETSPKVLRGMIALALVIQCCCLLIEEQRNHFAIEFRGRISRSRFGITIWNDSFESAMRQEGAQSAAVCCKNHFATAFAVAIDD